MFSCALLYVHSSFEIILMGKREMVALNSLSSWCLVMDVWLFLTVPWVCLRFLIVVFPDHTHYFAIFLLCLSDFALLFLFFVTFRSCKALHVLNLALSPFSPHPPLNQGLAILNSHLFGMLSTLSLP